MYRHFRNKDDLLVATMRRAGEQLAGSMSAALAASTDREALDRLVRSYVQIAIEHADTIAVYLAEVESLSPGPRRAVRRDQRAYVDEWQSLVTRLAPTLDADEARVAVHAAIGLVNGYADGRVRPPDDIAATVLVSMTTDAIAAVIGSPSVPHR